MKIKHFIFIGFLLGCFSLGFSQEKQAKKWQWEVKLGSGLVTYLNYSGVSHLYPTENKQSSIGYNLALILNNESRFYFGIQGLFSSHNNMLNTPLLNKETSGFLSAGVFVGDISHISNKISVRTDAGFAMLMTSSEIHYSNGKRMTLDPFFGYSAFLGGDFIYRLSDDLSIDARIETQLGQVYYRKLPVGLDAMADKKPNQIGLLNTSILLIYRF